MKRIFSIEYPDDLGPFWMNEDNLLLCLNAYCKNVKFVVDDVTDRVAGEVENTVLYDCVCASSDENHLNSPN